MAIDGHYWGKMREHDARRQATIDGLLRVMLACRARLDAVNRERAARMHRRWDPRYDPPLKTGRDDPKNYPNLDRLAPFRCIPYHEAPMIADIHAALERTGMAPGSVPGG